MAQILVLGLLGGIGSGKSTAASLLAEAGADVLDADRIAHGCLERQDVKEALVASFGPSVLGPDGQVDRARVADIVFADEKQRAQLNSIVHPCVRRTIGERLTEWRNAEQPRLVVLDVPLLLESELNPLCDRRLFIDTPLEMRRARVRETRGWTDEELDRREKTQVSIKEKREAADYTVVNGGPPDAMRAPIRALYEELIPHKPT